MANLEPVPSSSVMWRAYAVAPAVTPSVFMALLSVMGVQLPVNVVAAAFLVCYAVAGLIGMPIAFILRRRNALNAYTIHGAALLWGVVWSTACAFVAIYVAVAIEATIESVPLLAVWLYGFMVPPVVLAGTAFWILLRNPRLV